MASAKKNTAVAIKEHGSVSRPAYLDQYRGKLGNESIDNDDITVPRLKLAQAISDEVKKEKTVPEGALFLNVTGKAIWVPGDDPLPAIIVARSKEFILWRDRKDGGGILARAKPVSEGGLTRYRWDKPNTKFDVKVGGKHAVTWATKEYVDQDGLGEWGSEIPGNKDSGIAATAHHNYVVLLPTLDNLVCAISMSRSQVKKARDLNALLKMFKPTYPISAKQFTLASMDDKNGNGDEYKNWLVRPSEDDVSEDVFHIADGIKASFERTGFTVDQSGDNDADTNTDNGKL